MRPERIEQFGIGVFLLLLLVLFTNMNTPEFPTRNIDTVTVKKVDGQVQTLAPHLPAHDMTLDGRIALRRRGAANELSRMSPSTPRSGAPIYVLKPERVNTHLYHQSNYTSGDYVGTPLLQGQPDYIFDPAIVKNHFSELANYRPARTIICEKTETHPSPWACGGTGTNANKDCYRVTMITRFHHNNHNGTTVKNIKFASVDLRIRVRDPKTPNARIDNVAVLSNSYNLNNTRFSYNKVAEPVVVGDGRLLITRLGAARLPIPSGGPDATRINLVYSVYPESGTAQCDVSRWTRFLPITYAYHDQGAGTNNMRDRYKFARYQLRDSMNTPIGDRESIGGSYPWMDKDAANLVYTVFGKDDGYYHDGGATSAFTEDVGGNNADGTAYRRPGEAGLDIQDFEANTARTAGLAVQGFWTHGKMVVVDGQLNNADYNWRVSNRGVEVLRRLQLYTQAPGNQTFETVGGIREKGDEIHRSAYHPLLTPNSSFIGSIENRFNYVEALKTTTPRDIVWHFGSTRHTDELVFDDYISPFMLINAEMTAAVGVLAGVGYTRNYDGIVGGVHVGSANTFTGYPDADSITSAPALIQNSATAPSDFINLPKYGKVVGNRVRIEPIAKGGIHGKGLWLARNQGIVFEVPSQTGAAYRMSSIVDWYVGVFVDPRSSYTGSNTSHRQNLIYIDKASDTDRRIRLRKTFTSSSVAFNQVELWRGNTVLGRAIIPTDLRLRYNQWKHIGIQFENARPLLFIDGMKVARFARVGTATNNDLKQFFRLTAGDKIFLGSNNSSTNHGVKGWFDDLKVMARNATHEEWCNYARGTLVRMGSGSGGYFAKADDYPSWAHNDIRGKMGDVTGTKYLCYTKYGNFNMANLTSEDMKAHLKNLPANTDSIRQKMTHLNSSNVEQILYHNAPRPDFRNVQFCLSCHTSHSPFDEMNLNALAPGSVNASADERRQPSQPPARMSGVIPRNYFSNYTDGGSGPSNKLRLNGNGRLIDQWILPSN